MSRYALAALAAAIAFFVVWIVARMIVVLVSNAMAKTQEDFPPVASPPGALPVIIATVGALLAAYLMLRKR